MLTTIDSTWTELKHFMDTQHALAADVFAPPAGPPLPATGHPALAAPAEPTPTHTSGFSSTVSTPSSSRQASPGPRRTKLKVKQAPPIWKKLKSKSPAVTPGSQGPSPFESTGEDSAAASSGPPPQCL